MWTVTLRVSTVHDLGLARQPGPRLSWEPWSRTYGVWGCGKGYVRSEVTDRSPPIRKNTSFYLYCI